MNPNLITDNFIKVRLLRKVLSRKNQLRLLD